MIKDFHKFTERARHVLYVAMEEARSRNQQYVGTEHILLGLANEREGVVANVLVNMGVGPPKIRTAVELIIGRLADVVYHPSSFGERPNSGAGNLTLSPIAKEAIYLAVDEARRLNHHYIGTQHLLLGLLREGEGVAAGVLESLGVNLEKAREATVTGFNQSERSNMFKVQADVKYTVTFDGESVGLLRKVISFADKRLISGIESLPPEEEEQIRTFIIEFLDKTKG